MPDFFVITDQEMRGAGGLLACILERFDRCHKTSHAGLVVQVARADETSVDLHARVEGHKVTDADAQIQSLLFGGSAGIQPDLEAVRGAFHLLDLLAKNVSGGLGQQDRTAHRPAGAGEDGTAFTFNGIPGVAADLG